MSFRSFRVLALLGLGALTAVASCSGATDNNLFPDSGTGDSSMMMQGDTGSSCQGGTTSCAGSCVDTQTDNANCGACGKACAMKESCSAGACVSCMQIDKDKDGYNLCDDCDDNDPLVNPGAFEVPGNMKDDNCNGMVDEVVQCDMGLTSDSTNAADMVKAMDVCDAKFVVSSAWPMVASDSAHQIAQGWGMAFSPRFGSVLGSLSTGVAARPGDTKPMFTMATPRPGTDFMKSGIMFPTAATTPYQCGNGQYTDQQTVHDYTELTVTLKVPTNASSFAIDAAYLTAEYPDSLCNGATPTFDDVGFILLDSMGFKGNIAVGGAHGRALSVKSGLLALTTNPQLQGTGMDGMNNMQPKGAATPWMTFEAPVTPREQITLRFVLFDQKDGLYDTQLLLDNFRWQLKSVCAPDTTVLGDAGLDAGQPMCPDGGVMDAGGQ